MVCRCTDNILCSRTVKRQALGGKEEVADRFWKRKHEYGEENARYAVAVVEGEREREYEDEFPL